MTNPPHNPAPKDAPPAPAPANITLAEACDLCGHEEYVLQRYGFGPDRLRLMCGRCGSLAFHEPAGRDGVSSPVPANLRPLSVNSLACEAA